MSRPSSPVLKARKKSLATSRKLCLVSTVLIGCVFICILWVTLFDNIPRETMQDPGSPHATLTVQILPTIESNNSWQDGLPEIRSQLQPIFIGANSLSLKDPLNELPLPLTVVLPVTSTSISKLKETLHTIMTSGRALSELVLVSPQLVLPETRGVIRDLVASDEYGDATEFSLLAWPSGTDKSIAILHGAKQATTDWVLILDEDGLEFVHTHAREILLGLGLRARTVPFGPRGFTSSDRGLACSLATEIPQAVTFLIPPFALPSALLPNQDLVMDPVGGVWSSLGKSIAQSRSDAVGGYTVGDGELHTKWCPFIPSEHDPTADVPISPKLVDFPTSVIQDEHDADRDGDHVDQQLGAFALIFSSTQDLLQFSPAACQLQREGHLISSFVLERLPGDSDFVSSGNCRLAFDSSSQQSKFPDDVWNWISGLPTKLDVVITSTRSLHADFSITLERQLNSSSTMVRIPQADLPFCDWLGTLLLRDWKNWNTPRVDVSIITHDRPHSLIRLLKSLTSAHYFGDTLDLRINLEQTSDAQTMQLAQNVRWEHGHVFLHHRVIHGGLLPAVVESWFPHSNDSYGLILEDDVELSPLFYAWIKMTLLRYRYGKQPRRTSSQLFGISLYQQKHLELRMDGRHQFSARNTFAAAGLAEPGTPYLSQVPCSWGAVYFPEHWREFHAYLSLRLAESVWSVGQTVVPNVRSNKWTRSWKKYFIELVYLRGYVMLYPNYDNYVSLSTNHLEVGTHVKDTPGETYLKKKKLFLLPLMEETSPTNVSSSSPPPTGLLALPDSRLPEWTSLPMLDLLGLLASEDTLVERGRLRRDTLTDCLHSPSVLYDAWDLLCLDEAKA